MKLRIGLKSFKDVLVPVCFNIPTSDHLLRAKKVFVDSTPGKTLCHRWSRGQPQPRPNDEGRQWRERGCERD